MSDITNLAVLEGAAKHAESISVGQYPTGRVFECAFCNYSSDLFPSLDAVEVAAVRHCVQMAFNN